MGKATLISSLHFDNYKNLFLLLPTTFSPGENIKILEIFLNTLKILEIAAIERVLLMTSCTIKPHKNKVSCATKYLITAGKMGEAYSRVRSTVQWLEWRDPHMPSSTRFHGIEHTILRTQLQRL